MHSLGQLEPHEAARTVSHGTVIKRLGHLRVLSGVAPLRIDEQQQGVTNVTDVSPSRALTDHDLGRKRPVGCPTGVKI